MRKARKRVLSALLAAVLALGLMPSFAFAGEGDPTTPAGVTCDGANDCTHVAAIENVHYGTLAEAVNAAQGGTETTITLLKDVENGDGIIIESGKNITIDFDGHTYTVTQNLAGSSGTENQCFQLLKGSNVTLKDGDIVAGNVDIKMMIQNYSNLTLDNMTLDATKGANNVNYVCSNNFGNTVICDSTLIAAEGQAAFDVYYWPNGGYEDGVSVTVEGDSVITGKIEYGGDSTTGSTDVAKYASLNIKGGTFTDELSLGQIGTSSKASINITGGTFQAADNSVWESYVQSGMKLDSDGKIVINTNTAVARIGSVGYTTLDSAIGAAQDDDTITLLKKITDQALIELGAGKDVTIDLNAFDIGFTKNSYFKVNGGKLHLTGSGKVYEQEPYDAPIKIWGSTTDVADYSVVIVDENVTLEGWAGIFITVNPDSSGVNHAFGVKVTVDGTINSVKDTSENDGHGVYINGMNQDMSGYVPQITLGSTSEITSTGNGIYAAGYAVWNLAGDITAPDALSIKSGTFEITGGTYRSTGAFADPAAANSNGSENTGAALSITSNKSYAQKTEVNVTGGTFISENGYAVYEGIAKKDDAPAADSSYAEISISGGTFQGNTEKGAVKIAEASNKKVISGGTFSTEVRDYLANSIQYEVAHQKTGNFSYATSLMDAQKLAQPGDNITYLKKTEDNTVTLTLDYNGGATADSEYIVASGTEITLPEPTRTGYTFQGWYDVNGTRAGASYKVTADATLTAQWSANPTPVPTPEQFDVAVADVQNGAVELSAKTAKEGQKVTVTATPDLGYELAQLTVADEDGDALELTENADGTYSFTMPAGDVTVHASFADAWENPFTDLSEDHWGYGAVRTANLLGLMKGIGGTTLFGPDDGLLREQAATVMWNLMGAGDVSRPEAPQADVDQSQWYAPYVNWAVDSKVMDGYSEDDFGVGDSLTREQFAAVVAKAVGADVDSADQAALGAFPDADGVSGWARATMAWAVEAGVLNGVGTEDGSRELQATRELTRAEMATMMVNAIEVGVLDFGA